MDADTTLDGGKMPENKKPASPAEIEINPVICSHTYEGKIASLTGDKLVISSRDGEEYSYHVAVDAKVTCDDIVCRTEDLKAGEKIRLTTRPDDKHTAVKIESLRLQAEFAEAC